MKPTFKRRQYNEMSHFTGANEAYEQERVFASDF